MATYGIERLGDGFGDGRHQVTHAASLRRRGRRQARDHAVPVDQALRAALQHVAERMRPTATAGGGGQVAGLPGHAR
jgi:hypothetical protein